MVERSVFFSAHQTYPNPRRSRSRAYYLRAWLPHQTDWPRPAARRPAAGAGAAGAEPGGGSPEKIGGEIAGAGTNDAAGGRLPAGSRPQTLLPFDICEGSDRDENN